MPNEYPYKQFKDPLAIPSGAMRNAIQIQAQTATQDSYGQQQSTWSTILSCFAAFDSIAMGRPFLEKISEPFQGGFVSLTVHVFAIRWPGASVVITAANRIVCGTNVYEIRAVDNVQNRNRVLRLEAVQIDNAQVSS
ncbi:MAG: head-tail adaptor protein [Acidobacteriaceae bacterium]